jgi:hypothetical protein
MSLNPFAFQQARVQQVLFKSRLRSVLYGVREPEPALFEVAANPMHQWLEHELQPAYGTLPVVQELRRVLRRQLASGQELVQDYQRGRIEEARAGFARVEADAAELESLLTNLERDLLP